MNKIETDKLAEAQKPRQELIEEELKKVLIAVTSDFLGKGLLGVHELRAIPPISTSTHGEIHGAIGGSLFGFSGRIDGAVDSQPSIRFAWITNNEKRILIVTELPADKFEVTMNSEISVPTVEFQLNTPNFLELYPDDSSAKLGFSLAVHSFAHANEYLKGNNLRVARIRVTPKDFESIRTLSSGSSS